MLNWFFMKNAKKFSEVRIVVQSLSRVQLLRPHEPQHARPPCPSLIPRVNPNSCPLSQWCHSTISFSVVPFSSCPQSFPASGSFQMTQLFASGGQSIGVSASASFPPKKSRADLLQNGLVGSPCSPRDSRVFSNITVQQHQLFGAYFSSAQFFVTWEQSLSS